jgi:glutamate-5-semialdehyde dehydrogenase
MNSLATQWQSIAQQAKDSAELMRTLSTEQKNNALQYLAQELDSQRQFILEQNKVDLDNAKQKQLSPALIDRLSLDQNKIDQMIASIRQVIELPDPVGEITGMNYRPSGIQVGKMRSPLGVIAIIYESRPNVTIEASILCFKSGNACILRGGSEAIHSNIAIYCCIEKSLEKASLSKHSIQLLENTDRSLIAMMTQSPEYIDVIIPRGGEALIKAVSNNTQIPVIKHLHGVCHVYIDQFADIEMAEKIAVNAKTRRYGVCNAMETLLVDTNVAQKILPILAKRYQEKKVRLIGCEKTCQIIDAEVATEEDWRTEYLEAILSIKVTENIESAISHINHYGSAHSDAIVTKDINRAQKFLKEVDSSSVLINASTAFADGFEYGLGAEIGISTNKIHARGPVGLEGLTNQKYIVLGQGEIRS